MLQKKLSKNAAGGISCCFKIFSVKLSGLICGIYKIFYFCRRVSPVRPAPAEFPQGRKAARVGGCSGATQVAYPLFLTEKKVLKV